MRRPTRNTDSGDDFLSQPCEDVRMLREHVDRRCQRYGRLVRENVKHDQVTPRHRRTVSPPAIMMLSVSSLIIV